MAAAIRTVQADKSDASMLKKFTMPPGGAIRVRHRAPQIHGAAGRPLGLGVGATEEPEVTLDAAYAIQLGSSCLERWAKRLFRLRPYRDW